MRLFVGVDIPEGHKRSIEKGLQPLRIMLPDARWIPRSNWHVTLKFLGEVADHRAGEVQASIASSLADFKPVPSRLTELGAFPSTVRARVLWVGLDDPSGDLARLAAELDSRLTALGFRGESRPLHPHVTVARIKEPMRIGPLLDGLGSADLDRAGFTISEAVLYSSRLSRTGSQYEPLATFPATGSPPPP